MRCILEALFKPLRTDPLLQLRILGILLRVYGALLPGRTLMRYGTISACFYHGLSLELSAHRVLSIGRSVVLLTIQALLTISMPIAF